MNSAPRLAATRLLAAVAGASLLVAAAVTATMAAPAGGSGTAPAARTAARDRVSKAGAVVAEMQAGRVEPEKETVPPPPAPAGSATKPSMVSVPGGEFRMGALDLDMLASPEERPSHPVIVKAFRIDRFEVTNSEYRAFLEAVQHGHSGFCSPLEPAGADHTPEGTHWTDPEWNAPEKPVTGVSWYDAYAYCAWLGKRLPTEAEWERAARGSDSRRFTWGSEPPGATPVGNFADAAARKNNPTWKVVRDYDDGFAHTAPVGSFPKGASPYGVEDMAGNVWEWVADYWSPRAYGDPNSPTDPPAVTDPKGPAEGDTRVLRGGSWDSTGNFLRTTARHHQVPIYKGISFGFRCATDGP